MAKRVKLYKDGDIKETWSENADKWLEAGWSIDEPKRQAKTKKSAKVETKTETNEA